MLGIQIINIVSEFAVQTWKSGDYRTLMFHSGKRTRTSLPWNIEVPVYVCFQRNMSHYGAVDGIMEGIFRENCNSHVEIQDNEAEDDNGKYWG